MWLFPHSFKFQMDSLYISWQLSRTRKKKKGKHFLFLLFLFSPALFPLTLGLNPELLKKPPQPFPGVVCNNAGSVTVQSLCIHKLSPLLQARDQPPACFLDSYSITNQHSQREEEGGRYEFNYNRKLCFIILPLKTYWSYSTRALRGKPEGHRDTVWMNELWCGGSEASFKAMDLWDTCWVVSVRSKYTKGLHVSLWRMFEMESYGTNSQMHRLCMTICVRIKEVWEKNRAGVFETVKHP